MAALFDIAAFPNALAISFALVERFLFKRGTAVMISLTSLVLAHFLLMAVMLVYSFRCYSCDVWGRVLLSLALPEVYALIELCQRFLLQIETCAEACRWM